MHAHSPPGCGYEMYGGLSSGRICQMLYKQESAVRAKADVSGIY